MKTAELLAVVAIVTVPLRVSAKGRPPKYAVSRSIAVGGEGGWDYVTVDSDHGLLFLPRTTHTMVLDAATGKLVADIPGQTRNHSVALVPSAGRGFITDGKDASVTIFDLKDYKVLGKVKVADDADGIVYDPASGRVLIACGDAGQLVPVRADVDPATGAADAPIELGGKPEFLAVDGKGKAYVNLVDKNEIAVVDTKAMKVVTRWPTAPGGAPTGMAIDPVKRRLFVGCRKPQKMLVMSADDGKILASLPIGAGVDADGFDGGDAFASCRDGSLTVAREVKPGRFKVVQTLRTQVGSRTMGVDTKTHAIYLRGRLRAQEARPAVPKDEARHLQGAGRGSGERLAADRAQRRQAPASRASLPAPIEALRYE